MLYLTAHYVRGPDDRLGINGASHRSPGVAPPDTLAPDSLTIDADIGPTVATHTTVTPGGNRVESFLDVVAPDGAVAADIESAAATFLRAVPERCEEPVWSHVSGENRVIIRFWWNQRMELAPGRSFAALTSFATELLERASTKPMLVIEHAHENEQRTFRLSESSKTLLKRLRPNLDFAPVSIRDDVYADYVALRGAFEDEVPGLLLVDLTLMSEFGGVEFLAA
ncbi:MAG: hypothetical protein AUK47_21960 [Deltaproteobacteria bacterium CG2_30_63_29]|nr:MAG: hypothetical protein AUK47_21960 [Deltaproteobacteria bacterium CG2_30_63_29]PIV98279.1 MAG: hypothetical protein COW42_15645 [Deltaproteobacteria bacterium CG17_big_fil_post_rev_8_21_14_2_50_63_7]PJB40421.1 MAG: hypothetical protein CO108_14730 [Deltaproteobacteria bacterium CG_4_9_14_3_um_filter_63_12]